MRVALFGGTGFIGRALVPELTAAGHDVVLFVRPKPGRELGGEDSAVTAVEFDGKSGGEWVAALQGADAVVNIAGATIGTRWTADRKRLIRSSRVDFTEMLVEQLAAISKRPSVLVTASGAGFYGDRGDDLLTEEEPAGSDWLSQLAMDWEGAARKAEESGIRTVQVRTGIVLGQGGGSLPLLALPFKLFVGGPLGSGRQWFPWIHLSDIVGMYRFGLETASVTGPLNGVAGSVPEKDLAKAVGRALRRPSWFPTPVFGVRLLYGEFADALSASQRVSTEHVRELGYEYRMPELEPALREALGLEESG